MKAAWALIALVGATSAAAVDRPQLGADQAAAYSVQAYLAQGPSPWQPADAASIDAARPDFVVDARGHGTHRTVQAAVDAVPPAAAAQRRWTIEVRPGTYREPLCIRDKVPLLIRGDATQPAAVRIVEGRYNGLPKAADTAPHPCLPASAATTHGTSGSTSVAVLSDDVQLAHLTIANDATEDPATLAAMQGGAQAVALTTAGDRIQLHRVRLWSHQDTFYARRRDAASPAARVFVSDSFIAGDVDFVFGNATLVITHSALFSRSGRRGAESTGVVLAPSTPPNVPLGFLVTHSRFAAEVGVARGGVALGRAWDQGVAQGAWVAGTSPNGQAVVSHSELGPHVGAWAASTSRRPFSASGEQANRLAEFNNATFQPDPARITLRPNDGWAAAEGGTHGGAAAAQQDVFEVRHRAGLVAALSGPARPRIVKIHGVIDLSTDDDGRPLRADDFRDPAFEWNAFAKAYDPATWGRRNPEGPEEEARRRSAARQARHVVLRVPSDTSLIGMGSGAAVVGGMLLLEKVDNVIVRNLRLADVYDHFPVWDPNDNDAGEWNSDYDNLSLRNATHVWVDRCSFDDGDRPDAAEATLLGRRMQRHDGLLDITRSSNWVTVSWNHFRDHDKTSLVGSSDKLDDDDGRLKVTFHHNLWQDVKERAPRVRFGQVHIYNNLYTVRAKAPYSYSIGVGWRSHVFSQANAWEFADGVAAAHMVRLMKGGDAFFDRHSIVNGQPADLMAVLQKNHPTVEVKSDVGWTPRLFLSVDSAQDVSTRVRAAAGAARPTSATD